ncbi:10191_t:CDS:1, partial [Funneliformis geosporum]
IPEKLSDWQTTLKAVNPLLTESIITEAKKKDFEKYPHFKQVAAVKTWLEKVLASDKKLKADFKSRLTTADAEITDLASAFTKLEAKPLITLISRYEYDNLPDSGESEDKKQKTQTERRIKVLLNKTASDTLSEEELNTALFEVAAGHKTLSTKYYKADLSEITPQENPPNENNQQSWLRADNWQV